MSEDRNIPISRWEDITPETAMKYLETMNGNRAVRQQRIDLYAAQMKLGLWRPVPQGIIFDKEGHLVDGQHRLWAIVESGATVKMMVSRGLSPEDVAVLDSGLARNFGDAAHYAGWNVSSEAAGIARIMVLGIASRGKLIPHEVMAAWCEFYKEGIDLSLRIRMMTRGVGTKVIPNPVTLVFARAAYTTPHDKLLRIGEILRTGEIESGGDRAALALRDAWLTRRLGTLDTEVYGRAQSAVRAFLDRRPLKRLFEASGDLFPIKPLPVQLRYEAKYQRKKIVKPKATTKENA